MPVLPQVMLRQYWLFFDPAIVWHECKGMPFVKGDGIFKGHEAIVKNVFMNLPVYFDGFNIAVNQIFGADDKVVMVGYYQGANKATGNSFKANATHVWTVKDGKLTHFFQAVELLRLSVKEQLSQNPKIPHFTLS